MNSPAIREDEAMKDAEETQDKNRPDTSSNKRSNEAIDKSYTKRIKKQS